MLINLALEGGGIKGLAYVGALRYFEERGFQIHKISGSSVGAIFASLIACGYKSTELKNIIEEITVEVLVKKNNIKNVVRDKGMFRIENLEKKLEELLFKKGKKTFFDLKFGNDYLLKIIITEWKSKKMIIIPDDLKKYGIDPDKFSIAKAAVASSSIPFFYSQYKIFDYIFIDGGISNNFPIELVINDIYPVYGLRLNKEDSSIIKTIRKKIDIKKYDDYSQKMNIIYIDSLGLKANQFKLGLEKKEQLYISGYNSVKNYFNQKSKKKY